MSRKRERGKRREKIRDTVTGGSVLASGAQAPASVTNFSSQSGIHFAWNSYAAVPLHDFPASVHLCISAANQ
jgi:hypothetical protein